MTAAVSPAKPKRTRTPRPPKAETPAPPPAPAPKPRAPRVRKPKVAKPADELAPTTDPGAALALLQKMPAQATGDLSLDQQHSRYADLKRAITGLLGSFIWMGVALEEIRDQQYYRIDGYGNFDDFVQAEWDLNGKQRASQLIRASQAARAVAKFATEHGLSIPLPAVEFHCTELARLDTAEKQAVAWQEIVATAPLKRDKPHITGEFVAGVVKTHQGFLPQSPTKPDAPTKPKEVEPVPPTEVKPEDEVPPEAAAPEGPAPDTLEGYVPEMEQEIVKEGGKNRQMTPVYAMQYLIRALKGGFMYQGDPLVKTLAEVVQEGIVSWYDSPDGVVEIDYDEGPMPEFVAVDPPADEPVEVVGVVEGEGA